MDELVLIGHPFSSIGMGEQLRAGYRSVRSAGLIASLYDVYRYAARTDKDFRDLVLPIEAVELGENNVRIFHVNGDEIDGVLEAVRQRGQNFGTGYNVIVPAWELPNYPTVWAEKLRLFDDVWAISDFVSSSLTSSGVKNFHVGQSVERNSIPLLSRKYFGIRESAFALLHFFDAKSYPTRKNPHAAVELFKRIRAARPYDDLQLVLKVRSGDEDAGKFAEGFLEGLPRDVLFISTNLSSHEALSLVACNDCFVSLHRSEGFGRGLAEAMWFGRLALGTGWSGNCDFMNKENSLFVNHSLVDVREGDYPYWQQQKWAQPDIDHALYLALKAIDSLSFAKKIASLGQSSAAINCSNRAVGVRKLERLRQIRAGMI